jgi:hypothetical protein
VKAVRGVDVLLAFGEVIGDGVVVPAQRQGAGLRLTRLRVDAGHLKGGEVDAPTESEVACTQLELRRSLVPSAFADVHSIDKDNTR